MAILKKTLFPEDLNKYSVFLNDTDNRYFKISELPDVFTGGKNAFLIAGSEHLVTDTLIKIELKDSSGNIIYHEPGEGLVSATVNNQAFITQYYEGTSKVVAVYVYPDTAYGPCTLTILGELKTYIDSNGNLTDVPTNWANSYNVKFEKQVNVNPSLANTTKIRFYRRPIPTITETLQPIYQIISGSKVNSGIYQSFANVKLSNLETFAGDVKRVKVFRTSNGDISDYDLIQDILVESKELLTTYNLSSSVVGTTGIFSQEVLNNFWNTGSLRGELTSSRVENGLKISGSGVLTYLQPIDFKSGNTYELSLNAFYSGSTENTLTAYIASGSTTSSVAVLDGIPPTKNLKDSIYQFKVDSDYISGSLFFSQSNAEWHVGNLSLKLTQETAFSPDEISFVTSMPTVVGNETYNFKFEFYDVNNNYVPVYVTQSAQFTGGTNFNNIILAISSSASGSLSGSINYINQVSSSISGTAALYLTSSVATASAYLTQSIATASYSSSIVSASVYSLSGSVSSSLTIVSGGITLLSGSFLQFTQSYYSASASFDTRFVSQSSYAASQSLYQVYSASAYLDTFIFTDANGKVNQPPTASAPGLYLGSTYMGYYSGSGTAGWKTYMDDQGDFYLTSSIANSGFLAWNAASATLQIQGAINIQGGNAATTSSLNSATSSLLNSINSATASLSSSLAPNIFTTTTGLINRPPNVLVGSTSGLYLGSSYLGYYNGSDWKTYMANNGNFYLSGAGSDSLSWASGVLTINGAINITGGNAATTSQVSTAAGNAVTSGSAAASTAQTNAQSFASTVAANAAASASISASAVQSNLTTIDNKIFTDALGRITKTPSTGTTAGLYLGSANLGYYNGSSWKTYMDNTGLFYLTGSANGNALLWDGANLTIRGTIKVGGGEEVTSTTISNANSALQSGQTGKSLGLTGGSVGGVTISSNKIYVGTGIYGNANTGFYVDSDGNMSLKDKLTWDNSTGTLSITGNVVITGGATKDAIDSKITGAQVNANVTSISGGVIQTNTIYATQIASLAFYGKTAQFDTGDIGGWTISGEYLGKDVGASSGYGFKIDSTNKKISITKNSTGIEKVRIDPSDSIPALVTSYTDTVTLTGTGQQLNSIDASTTNQYRSSGTNVYLSPTSGRSDSCTLGNGYNGNNGAPVGVIGLIYANEEIWVDTAEMTPNLFAGCINVGLFGDSGDNDGYDDYVFARYTIALRVRKYANCNDATNDTNVIQTYLRDIAYIQTYIQYSSGQIYNDSYQYNVNDCAVQVDSQNNYFRIDFQETTSTSLSTGNSQFQTTRCTVNRFNGDIKVRFGRVDNGYSIFSPGGLQIYQGVKAYLNASTPTAAGKNFFEVKGKSAFLSGLYVSGTFSADNKQFQITHPLNEKKWLYHTSIEAPKAELIYRGVIELENGIGSASIDSVANMTMGTFEKLSRNSQIFLQNNESFDRIKGRIESGSVYILCENQNSTASIDWTVIAERCDQNLLNTNSYTGNGKYITERYKSEYSEEVRLQIESQFNTGSI